MYLTKLISYNRGHGIMYIGVVADDTRLVTVSGSLCLSNTPGYKAQILGNVILEFDIAYRG